VMTMLEKGRYPSKQSKDGVARQSEEGLCVKERRRHAILAISEQPDTLVMAEPLSNDSGCECRTRSSRVCSYLI
jgi:hypothetical protein